MITPDLGTVKNVKIFHKILPGLYFNSAANFISYVPGEGGGGEGGESNII